MATAKKAAKQTAAKKAVAKKAAANKTAAKKARAKKASAKKAPANKTAAKKAPAKKAPANKTAAKKVSAKKVSAKKVSAKKVSAKKATKKLKSPFGKKFTNEMKARLIGERAKYLHSAEEYRAEADSLIEGREPGDVQFDEESGDGDTVAVERERDLALSAQARTAVDQIDAALDRIAAGTYGLCVTSQLPIPQERLKAIPWAAQRVEYKVGGLGRP